MGIPIVDRKRGMATSQLNQLRRQWLASGEIADYVRYQAERWRIGELRGDPLDRLRGPMQALAIIYEQADGVLEFFQADCPIQPSPEQIRPLIIQFIKTLSKELGSGSYSIDKTQLNFSGQRISLREFLGWAYDSEQGCILKRGLGRHHLNDYFTFPYQEVESCLRNRRQMSEQWDSSLRVNEGFVYSFTEPPYGMSLRDSKEMNNLFHGVCYSLFGGLSEDLEIYRWETHWTDYFLAGREWWGEYLWSVYRPGDSKIAIIAGSTTD